MGRTYKGKNMRYVILYANEERLAKAKEKLAKLKNKVDKYKKQFQDLMAKHKKTLEKIAEKEPKEFTKDEYLVHSTLRDIVDEHKRASYEYEKYEKTVQNLENMIKVNQEKKDSIPEIFNPYMKELIEVWDEYDKKEKERLLKIGKNFYLEEKNGKTRINYAKQSYYEDKVYKTDDQIHKNNEKAAIKIIANLISRVKEKVGTITNYKNLSVNMGNFYKDGGNVINGYVEGEKGSAVVKSIHAGGHSKQRLHIRVLVK